jgi:hypothetical protein
VGSNFIGGGSPPIERLLADAEVSRPVPDMDALNLAFTRQVTRTQRKSDATVTVDGMRFEVPSRFRCLSRLTLRHAGWDLSRLILVDSDRGNLTNVRTSVTQA